MKQVDTFNHICYGFDLNETFHWKIFIRQIRHSSLVNVHQTFLPVICNSYFPVSAFSLAFALRINPDSLGTTISLLEETIFEAIKLVETIRLISIYKPRIKVTLKLRIIKTRIIVTLKLRIKQKATQIIVTKTPKPVEIIDHQIGEVQYFSSDVSDANFRTIVIQICFSRVNKCRNRGEQCQSAPMFF